MPEMIASHSSQRFAALLDFQRDVDLMNPSHIGNNSAPGHVRRTHHGGDNSWQQNWWDSLSSFLSSTTTSSFRGSKLEAVAPSPPRPFGVKAIVTRSQGHFSPQKLLIRNVLKRALYVSRDDEPSPVMNVKRARTRNFDYVGYGSNPAMVLCG